MEKSTKNKKTGKLMPFIVASACLTMMAVYLTACSDEEIESTPPESNAPVTTEAETKATEPPVTEFPDMLPDHLDLWEKNNDMVGYLEVCDEIREPVMQGEDNIYYTEHNFNKEYAFSGAITADYKNKFIGYGMSDITLLYGHNMKNGTYFKPMSRYYTRTLEQDLSFYKENPTFRFDSMYERMEWKVFAVVLHNTQEEYGEVIEFWDKTEFEDEDDFNDTILNIMDRSILFTDVDLEYGDKITALMTCLYPDGLNCRIVVYARKVRPGESSEVDVSKAKYNKVENKRSPGAKWIGEVGLWDSDKYLTSYNKDEDE